MNIAWPYWKGSEPETLPDVMFVTETWTVCGDEPCPLGVMLGETQTTWL
jgi:hypothetical protein